MDHSSGLLPRVKLAATFQFHRRGILNWWRSQISNGLIQAAMAKA
jgi:hypothetical protein